MGFPGAGVLCVLLKAYEEEALCKMVASSFILHNFHHWWIYTTTRLIFDISYVIKMPACTISHRQAFMHTLYGRIQFL